MKKDEYKSTRILYIIEATLEYFISIAVGTVYLAKLTAYIGISDALTGILSSFVSLGCCFQIFAIFLSKYRPVKTWVTVLQTVSQVLFALLYIIPLFAISKTFKTIFFILFLLVAQVIHNLINAPKINWYMSLIEDKKRGSFTANKEMVSLIGGVLVSYLFGYITDFYTENDEIKTAFLILACIMLSFTFFHTLSLIFSKEKPYENIITKSTKDELKKIIKNKDLFKLFLVSALWNVANYATISFTGTYQTKELGFTTTFSSIIIIVGSLFRVVFSIPLGKFADKHSFSNMLIICFVVETVAFGINIFTNPHNGSIFFFVYYVLYCIGQAGINSSLINLIYDYVQEEQRTSALAMNQTIYGLSGFLITLLLTPIISLLQENGNKLFGITVYAQQIFSAFSMVISIVLILYISKVVKRIKKGCK